MQRDLKFLVAIPMYNEAVGCEECIETVSRQLLAISKISQILVVNDGSTDETPDRLIDISLNSFVPIHVIHHTKNLGYGAAVNSAIKYVLNNDFDYILFIDSDLTNNPKDLVHFYESMQKGYDVIKATRYSDGGAVEGVPFIKVIISKIGNYIAKILFNLPITDYTNGFRAIRIEILKNLKLKENGFSVIMEEMFFLRKRASSYCNVPVTLKFRSENLRKSSFVYTPKIFIAYLKYPIMAFINYE